MFSYQNMDVRATERAYEMFSHLKLDVRATKRAKGGGQDYNRDLASFVLLKVTCSLRSGLVVHFFSGKVRGYLWNMQMLKPNSI